MLHIGGSDFESQNSFITFPAATRPGFTVTLNLSILDDDMMEGTEDFLFNATIITPQPGMATVVGGSLQSSVTVTVLDDDSGKKVIHSVTILQ